MNFELVIFQWTVISFSPGEVHPIGLGGGDALLITLYLASGMVNKTPTGHLLPAPLANYQLSIIMYTFFLYLMPIKSIRLTNRIFGEYCAAPFLSGLLFYNIIRGDFKGQKLYLRSWISANVGKYPISSNHVHTG